MIKRAFSLGVIGLLFSSLAVADTTSFSEYPVLVQKVMLQKTAEVAGAYAEALKMVATEIELHAQGDTYGVRLEDLQLKGANLKSIFSRHSKNLDHIMKKHSFTTGRSDQTLQGLIYTSTELSRMVTLIKNKAQMLPEEFYKIFADLITNEFFEPYNGVDHAEYTLRSASRFDCTLQILYSGDNSVYQVEAVESCF